MKKTISILATAIVVFLASVSLISCSKSDASASLEGTTWTATESTHGSVYNYTLTFGKSTFSMQFTSPGNSEDGPETETYAGTYIYENPAVIMTAMIYGENTTFNGVRDGDKLTLNSSLGALTFTKK